MDDWEDPVSDRSFRTALLEALNGRPQVVRPGAEGLLWIASTLLLGTNLLLALFVNVVGGRGPANPSRILWASFGMDLVGVALLGWIFWYSAARVVGPGPRPEAPSHANGAFLGAGGGRRQDAGHASSPRIHKS